MEEQVTDEQTLISIARTLPPERVVELLNFARFLQILEVEPGALESEDKWDKLFALPEAQSAMLEMARETREDFHAGRTTDITVTNDGKLAPK